MTISVQPVHRPRPFSIPVSLTIGSRNGTLGLSSSTMRMYGLQANQYVLAESATTRDSGSNDAECNGRTILAAYECQMDDGSACVGDDALENIRVARGDSITLLPLNYIGPITKVTIGLIGVTEVVPENIIDGILRPFLRGQRGHVHEHDRFGISYKGRDIAFKILKIENAEYGVVDSATEIVLSESRFDSIDGGSDGYSASEEKGPIIDGYQSVNTPYVEFEGVTCENGAQFIFTAPGVGLKLRNVRCGRGSFQFIGVGLDASLVTAVANLPYR